MSFIRTALIKFKESHPIETDEQIRQRMKAYKINKTRLKVKIKNLVAEAGIIKEEENKANFDDLRIALRNHRKTIVRSEARDSLLAYACIRGIAYSACEKKAHTQPNWNNIRAIAKRFALWGEHAQIDLWVEQAKKDFVKA